MKPFALIFTSLCALGWTQSARADGADQQQLAARLANAKSGTTITLESRTYQVGDLMVPAGVTLRGAGYDKTIINATGHKTGVLIRDSKGARASDLTVTHASETGVLVTGASGVGLARLKVVGNLTGLLLSKVTGSRVENLVVARNRTGASLAGNTLTALVNCSFVDNPAIALTVSAARNVAVFNNVFVNSPTALYLTSNNVALGLDYNFYIVSFFGKLEGEVSRTTLPAWQRVSGHDAHSVSMPITFADPATDNYRPSSTLPWAPTLATTGDWGTAAMGGFAAPTTDIDGAKRVGAPDLGAYEGSPSPERPSDGSFDIATDDGVKSAGLYNADNIRVATFFQNLPLHKGRHAFWLPDRDNQNRPFTPGAYQVRVVESQLNNPYLGLAGNFGKTSFHLDNRSWAEEMFAFDNQDRLYIAQNAFENGMGVRAFDANYDTPRWMMPGGGGTVGVATDANFIYYLQRTGEGQYNLRKINLDSGVMGQIGPGVGNRIFTAPFSKTIYGMTQMDGKLYVSDSGAGKVFVASAADPKFDSSFDVPGAASVTADAKTHLLWVIGAGGKLLALDPATGTVKATSTPVDGPKDIGANNGRLAVLSPKTGKVVVLDAADPANLKPVLTIGTGDGPGGPQKPDRFWFQQVPGAMQPHKTHVALNSKGEVAIIDDVRTSFWAADGSLKKQGMGFWGQHNYLARLAGDDDVRIWGMSGDYSIKMDSKNKHWSPDTRWVLPPYTYDGRSPRGYFTTGGKNFALFAVRVGDPGLTADHKVALLDFDAKASTQGLLVVRLDTKAAVPVSLYYNDSAKKTLVEQHDTNNDGMVDAADPEKEMRFADGTAAYIPWDRYGGWPRPNGDLVYDRPTAANNAGVVVQMLGLDPSGTFPVYTWDKQVPIPSTVNGKDSSLISPYDYKTVEQTNASVQIAPMSDGGYASSVYLRSSGGTGLANGAGTDIAGFGKDGRLRWIYKLNTVQGSEGVQSIPQYKMVMGMTSTTCDYMVSDEDGLGMGALSMPKEANWQGMWSDHAQQQQTWVGNDGKPYYILGDYSVNGFHWFEITGMEKTKRHVVPVQINEALAANLAKLPALVAEKLPSPPTTKVKIARLAAPLPIDGDLKKWRNLAPAALVTPETGTADIVGPQDCSAVIRLAYHGSDLYVQTIVFDNVVTFHQPMERMFQEDGIEMGINSFMQGFKYNVAITTDHGPTVFRNRFAVGAMDRIYTNEEMPRSIKVYDDASQIEERQYIEAIYGVDLSKSKVIVTEFKLPLTGAIGFSGDPAVIPEVAPGKTFWIGFFLNDNDMPGGDLQKYLAWPATYGTFAVKEAGALATFE